jgi:hypothetical protein
MNAEVFHGSNAVGCNVLAVCHLQGFIEHYSGLFAYQLAALGDDYREKIVRRIVEALAASLCSRRFCSGGRIGCDVM